MTNGQLRFDGELFSVVRFKVNASGLDKVGVALDGDDRNLKRGDIIVASCGYWVSPHPFEKFNGDGIGVEPPELVYSLNPVPGFHPFTVEKVVRRRERSGMYGQDQAVG
jgi:hypothetical protein